MELWQELIVVGVTGFVIFFTFFWVIAVYTCGFCEKIRFKYLTVEYSDGGPVVRMCKKCYEERDNVKIVSKG